MKKKLLSLLLVIAVMMTSVSMGFGSLAAFATGAVGGGVEAINAFSLTGTECTGTSVSGSITIKSKVSGYQIKVNSVTASIRYYQDDTSVLNTVTVDSSVIGAVCTTSGSTFAVTGTISSGLAGLIRYECNYDLQDSSGNTVYAGMTGYGYGYVSASGSQTGAVGSYITSEPSTPGSSYGFDSFAQINTCYVQTPNITLSCVTETSGGAGGKSNATRTMSLSGTYPSTLSVANLYWPGASMYATETSSINWFVLTTPPSGYYNFSVVYNGSTYANVEMYYRDDTARSTAETKMNTYLGEGLEKSYYTEDSWNAYLTQLEKVALAAKAMPGPNYAFKVACQTVQEMSGAAALESAKQALVPVKADWTEALEAYNAFYDVKDNTVTVRTYAAGATALGSESIRLYTQASVDELEAWLNAEPVAHYVADDINMYDQYIVDNYTAEILERTANLTYSDAVYTYMDVAIDEYENAKQSDYTTTTWAAYKGAVDIAKALSRELNTTSQSDINTSLMAIVSAKANLKYVAADTTELLNQIAIADTVYDDYDAGELITAADGFDEVWDNFEDAYNAAVAVKNYTIDKQEDVDNAANTLKVAIAALSSYRVLDTTELQKVLALTPEYESSKYVADSYNMWSSLRVEGYTFLGKASISYTGSDRKTYDNLEEMNRLIELIQSAYDNLEKVKADFTELDKYVAKIPSDDVLALYEQAYVDAIRDVVATIDYGATFDEQDSVDEITLNLKYALAELTEEHYKTADYTDVDAAISEAEALDGSIYTNYSIVEEAIAAVDRTKKIVDQDDVDAMAAAIREAIAGLEYIAADYTEVNAAIAEAEAVENKDWYANYDRVEELIAAVDWDKKLSEQAEVDAYAAAIREAIANLTLDEADYSGIRAAIAEAEALEPLKDFNDEFVESLDLAISKVVAGYTKDRQAEVDAMEAEIRAVLATAEENLLLADYSKLNVAVDYAKSFKPAEYSNYEVVQSAIDAVDWNLNCRQTTEMQAQIEAIYSAVNELKLLPADYTKVDVAIEAARYAYNNGDYEYTEESIKAVEDAIGTVNRDLDVQHQSEVDAYVAVIEQAVAGLTYVRADYTALDDAIAQYNALQRDLYASLADIDAYVAALDMNKTIDKQSEVDAAAEELTEMLGSLEYAPADYTAVNNAKSAYDSLNKNYYEAEDLALVEEAISAVVEGYTRERQAEVDKMAQDINDALDILRTKIKSAVLTDLEAAVAAANAKVTEMNATGYEIDQDTLSALSVSVYKASKYDETTKISSQDDIDALTAQIIEETANLEYVFTIDLTGTGLVIDENGYIYGFEEGTMAGDARELIFFVGAAELKIYETKNGFGTGTMIQFISTKDGSILGTYTVLVFGDANGDAVVDTLDVAYVTEIVNSGDEPSAMLLKVLDFDRDGYIDALDVAGLISIANMDYTLMQDGTMGTY